MNIKKEEKEKKKKKKSYMVTENHSFIKDIIGRNTYDELKGYAREIIPLATVVLVVLWVLSIFVHWEVVSSLLSLTTGASLIFIVYIIGLIILLDKGVDVEVKENYTNDKHYHHKEEPEGYGKTIVYGVFLIVMGIAAIYFSNKYRKNYSFECETFLVDPQEGIYHLDNNGCVVAADASNLEKMKGYQINEYYTLCDWCEEWAEDAEDEFNSDRYFRR